MKLPNRNQVLIAIGLLSTEGPDVAAVAAWLPTLGIPHLTGLIHLLGTISLTLGGLALAWPRIRSLLASAGLATPPGAVAPWNPARDAGPTTAAPCSLPGKPTPPAGSNVTTLRPGAGYGQKGFVSPFALAIVFGLAVLGVVLTARICKADEPVTPQLGGCVANGEVCFGTAADVVLTKVGLSAGNKGISGGFATGVGYGATVAPNRFYATGLDLFLNVNLSGASGVASRVSPALMLHTMNYLFIGVAMDITAPLDSAGSYGTGWNLLLGFGSTITSITPGYAKREAARQLAAERANAAVGK